MNNPSHCKDFMRPYIPKPVPESVKKEGRAKLYRQCREVITDNHVTCECGRIVRLTMAYKCFYCGLWFCHTCARKHFAVPEEWQGWSLPHELLNKSQEGEQ